MLSLLLEVGLMEFRSELRLQLKRANSDPADSKNSLKEDSTKSKLEEKPVAKKGTNHVNKLHGAAAATTTSANNIGSSSLPGSAPCNHTSLHCHIIRSNTNNIVPLAVL